VHSGLVTDKLGVQQVSDPDGKGRILSFVEFPSKGASISVLDGEEKERYEVRVSGDVVQENMHDDARRIKIKTRVAKGEGSEVILFDDNKGIRVFSGVQEGAWAPAANGMADDEGRLRVATVTQVNGLSGQMLTGQTGKEKAFTVMGPEDEFLSYHEKGAIEQADDFLNALSRMKQTWDIGAWFLQPGQKEGRKGY
jgi:hypothetical protein